MREIQCTEVWGGAGACDVSVLLAGVRGECWSQPFHGVKQGGDIHFLSVCGMSILSKVVLADVSGHGAETAEVSEIIHRALVENIGAHDNSTMLHQVNDSFMERRRGAFKFTTMVTAILDSRDRSLVYAYAGHPAILRGAAATGCFEPVRSHHNGRGGIPLGVLPGTEYSQHLVQLDEGDVLVFYTDAFSEAPDKNGGMLGAAGLASILEEPETMAPAALKSHVLDRVGRSLEDDASLILLEVL